MSARKRKSPADVQPIFDSIQDVLVDIKPKLAENRRPSSSSVKIIEDLHKVATLAESLSHRRPRTHKDWSTLADALDREGVNLWNVSGQVRSSEDDASRSLFAALRLAGFRLIEAGLEQKPSIETLIHVLQLASKTSASLSEIGRNDVAATVLTCAAKYEEDLKIADDAEGLHQQNAARAIVLFYSSRLEAAWREHNESVADYMLQKINENDNRLGQLPARDKAALATKLLEIGKSSLRQQPDITDTVQAENSVRWMQKAFSIIEKMDSSEVPGLPELKRSILRSLARAYFLTSSHAPDNLSRAEASLNELMTSIDSSLDRRTTEYQQLRWMRLAILKRRKASQAQFLEAFQSIIDHVDFSLESNITDILQELRTMSQHHVLISSVHQYALEKVLETKDNSGHAHIDRLLLSLLFHCSRDENHARAMQDINSAFTGLDNAEYILPKIPTTACLTLLWQFGDRNYNAKRWSEAADWFLAGTHHVFDSMAQASRAKCFRKAALCYLQQRDYSQASTVMRKCPNNEAATHYVRLLTAVQQGLEDEAMISVQEMVQAPDFDRKMLLLATQLVNQSDMKTLLLSVLEALLMTVKDGENMEFNVEALTLIRCIIRLVMKLIGDPVAKKSSLVHTLICHFRTALALVNDFHVKKRATLVSKDISWLWRTAYNCAVQGCSEWESSEESASDLFDIARRLLEIYCTSTLTDVDAELYAHLADASFAAIAGRMFAIRQYLVTGSAEVTARLTTISDEIQSCKGRIHELLENKLLPGGDDTKRATDFICLLRVFEVEVLSGLMEWKQLSNTIEEVSKSNTQNVDTFEAIADILWVDKECPVEVLFTALEAILHASLDRLSLSVDKFSRWLRAICTILLSRNTTADRAKAIGYVEQAISVIEEHSESQNSPQDVYPVDERQWLLGTAYNTGVECLYASLIDEARRWFESSTMICRFIPDGKARSEKISDTYTQLLAQYISDDKNIQH
ncbi:Sporulation-specific protein 22/ZIP4 [Abortiporus biennis]